MKYRIVKKSDGDYYVQKEGLFRWVDCKRENIYGEKSYVCFTYLQDAVEWIERDKPTKRTGITSQSVHRVIDPENKEALIEQMKIDFARWNPDTEEGRKNREVEVKLTSSTCYGGGIPYEAYEFWESMKTKKEPVDDK